MLTTTGHRCFKLLHANQAHNNHAVSNRSLRFSRTKSVAQRQLHVTSVIPSLQGDASSQSPPDLPSYIFKERIVYLGMTLVPSVTELILAELLYLQYEDSNKPVQLYINSTGTSKVVGHSVLHDNTHSYYHRMGRNTDMILRRSLYMILSNISNRQCIQLP
mmetsp:Transcript_5942/g.19974  ORF Transcript_5942/g.19974 Transcript_5942/m.19974 type:complete len:161 (-) Transcript_5942:1207-1689(-)